MFYVFSDWSGLMVNGTMPSYIRTRARALRFLGRKKNSTRGAGVRPDPTGGAGARFQWAEHIPSSALSDHSIKRSE